MDAVIVTALVLVAVGGTAVVSTGDPARQALTMSAYGLSLAILFVAFAAPDVALSELGVGAAVVPLMVLLAIRKIRATR